MSLLLNVIQKYRQTQSDGRLLQNKEIRLNQHLNDLFVDIRAFDATGELSFTRTKLSGNAGSSIADTANGVCQSRNPDCYSTTTVPVAMNRHSNIVVMSR